MEALVYPTTIDGDKRTIITKAACQLQIEPTAQVATYFYEVVPPGYHLSAGRTNKNEQSHVAVTYSGKKIKFYINGKEVQQSLKPKGKLNLRLDGESIWVQNGIGVVQGTIIDEIKIFNYVKTKDEILKSMQEVASVSLQAKLPQHGQA